MQLTLVRHGEAALAQNGNDHKRPLTERGHQQAEQTAQYLKQQPAADVFIVSPLLRAQQTLAHLQAYFPQVPVLICDKIKPDDVADDAVEWLAKLPFDNIVVVCHMNVIGHIAAQLTADPYHPFALAEARIYQQSVIASGLSTEQRVFVPTV